ncbi:DUF1569 domain-containing protein [Gemmatimonas phototrophica]|uniref:DinB-like domain-containing protein n=1 Tax=Gemmatimonas phototrophica TaxID=1379270 RepID=A0A143BND9_9BACT|nr:DUF1569 domain-containing protein [Gemmatimonas phototrophica]AMW06095.1 hypothetical protein GEMMAAP_17485 [Gemmatimonas phototrophica]
MPVYPNLFEAAEVDAAVQRLAALTPKTVPAWGSMSVATMLAHVNVAYEMVYDDKHPRPNALMRFVLKRIVKQKVVGPDPYPHNTPTAPVFRIKDTRDFHTERERLVAYLRRVQHDGQRAFEGRESLSFGPLTAAEWNGLFSKHLDHHLRQFGV